MNCFYKLISVSLDIFITNTWTIKLNLCFVWWSNFQLKLYFKISKKYIYVQLSWKINSYLKLGVANKHVRPVKVCKKTGRSGAVIIEDVCLKFRSVRKKARVEWEKPADTVLFKSKNIKFYINIRTCKSPRKKRDETE